MKKALIFSPYLDSIGGGEVYTMHFAKGLEMHDYKVELAWHDERTLKTIHQLLGIKLETLTINQQAYRHFRQRQMPWQQYQFTKQYDLIFFLSDGSVPLMFASKNIIHFQIPFSHMDNGWLTKLKLRNQKLVTNSIFTQSVIDSRLQTKSQVLYPPVDLKKSGKKQKIILSVGRFTDRKDSKNNNTHNKRQDVMIEAFKSLHDQGYKDWKLILAGNDYDGQKLVPRLQKLAKNYPIEIQTNISFTQLNKLYASSSIYWHAAGFGIHESKYPERVEHFGISTVEAMSAGCVPVVIRRGGQREIVKHNRSGYLFNTKQQLVSYTQSLIDDKNLYNDFATKAIESSQQFGLDRFYQQVGELCTD